MALALEIASMEKVVTIENRPYTRGKRGGRMGRPPIERIGPDRGTKEGQARREFTVGDGKDALACFPLGVMRANEIIDEDLFRAGCRYAWMYAFTYGRTSLAAQAFGQPIVPKRERTDQAIKAIKAQITSMGDALLAESRATKDELDNVVVFGRFPDWLLPRAPRPNDMLRYRRLMAGLRIVAGAG